MTAKLKDGSINMAAALTEGLVAGIANGHDFYKIVGTYVSAPLCWALSAGANSKHDSIDTLNHTDVGISRFGSGSHIMAFVLADQQGWLAPNVKENPPFTFTVLGNFKAMRDAVNDGTSDYFMWETFTTKPYHDSGEIKRIGQITPPWPAFSFAASTDLIEKDSQGIIKALEAIEKATKLFMAQKDKESVQHIMRVLDYQEVDVREWFKTVRYEDNLRNVSRKALDITVETLIKAGVIEKPIAAEDLVDERIAKLSA
jgi:ABC-type nitrate/sulfonate/bicarbonate transport system substrate-binding protein